MLTNSATLETRRLASPSLRQEASYPRFVSFVAVGLGCFDIVRGVVHTVLAGSLAVDVSGIDVSGPSGRDLIVLMTAFGHANFITAAALIQAGLTSRMASLILLSVIPLALLIAGVSLHYWGADLQGVGVFPGMNNMRMYMLICTATVATALLLRWRRRPLNRGA
ncbi:MAG: hypothetical protein AAFY29_09090 [Pseudomonadota bacterium]